MKGSKEYYRKEVIPYLMEKFSYRSVMECPELEKIVLNMGLSEAKNNKNVLTENVKILTLIAGQKVVSTLARKSEAGFKIREGMPIGARVTLRRDRMYDFLVRLININIPRVKDFQGISNKSFDSNGNYSFGITDCGIFVEVAHLHSSVASGIGLQFVTSSRSRAEVFELLLRLGMPFKEKALKSKRSGGI